MTNIKLGQMFLIAFFIVAIGGIIQLVGLDILGDPNLTNESVDYISSLNEELSENYGVDKLQESESQVSTNASNRGLEAFSRSFVESKASAEKKVSAVSIVKKTPDTFLLIFNLEKDQVGFFYNLFVAFIVFILAIMLFILLFGPGRT